MDSPDGEAVDIQIKSPGEENPIAAIQKAPRQLVSSPHRCLVAVCSRSEQSVACEPNDFLSALIGPTEGLHANVVRLRSRGLFGDTAWSHIGGVVLLDYIAGLDNHLNEREVYTCTALLNPWCSPAKRVAATSLPRARSLILDGERFRWEPSDPDRAFNVPTGTYLPAALR